MRFRIFATDVFAATLTSYFIEEINKYVLFVISVCHVKSIQTITFKKCFNKLGIRTKVKNCTIKFRTACSSPNALIYSLKFIHNLNHNLYKYM